MCREELPIIMKKNPSGRFLVRFMTFITMLALLVAVIGCGAEKKAAPAGSGSPAAQQESAKQPEQAKKPEPTKQEPAKNTEKSGYSMRDIKGLKNTKNFSRNGLEHIFDGTINKKGKATGYHYSMIADSKGKILNGTRSRKDANGIFTAKVEIDGVKKDGFSSFYPENWSPQEVVDAINTAYDEAVNNPKNPRGSLWIGHAGRLEIDMYLDDNRKILTAYPIFQGE